MTRSDEEGLFGEPPAPSVAGRASGPGSVGANRSALGRLLEELSWVGSSIRGYRSGGRGYENVLTAEVLGALDFMPRSAFLGAVIAAAHGADVTRERSSSLKLRMAT